MKRERVQVVIVGAGPVGLTLANLLGIHGVRAAVLERNAATVGEPRAVAIDAESMRTLQAVGLAREVERDLVAGMHVDYVGAGGRRLFSLTLGQTPYGHAQQNAFDQPALERVLLAGLGRFAHVDARFEHALTRLDPSADGVLARGVGPGGAPFELEADYAVGCDGGRSSVRKQLGIGMSGRTAPERWLVLDTVDEHLAETLDCRFFCDPARPGMTLRRRHGKRRWEWMQLPGESDEQLLDDAAIRALIAPYTRASLVKVEQKRVYSFHTLVADRYRVGRVFLAGDAAHMMPPFAGQGMNSGVRDAQNLSWKLALVLRGAAPAALLDSYEEERRAHVVEAIRLATRLGAMIQPTSRVRAALRDALLSCVNASSLGLRLVEQHLLGFLQTPELRSGVLARAGAARHGLVGQYVVQPLVRAEGGALVWLDELLGPGFAVLGFGEDPRRAIDAETRAFWAGMGARFVHVAPRGTPPAGGAVEDMMSGAFGWFRDHGARFVVVRPDRFCAAQFTPGSARAAARAFEQRLRGAD